VSSPQTVKPQHTTPANPCKQNLPFAERNRLAEEAQRKALRENVDRLIARRAREAAEADARRAAAQAKVIAERAKRPPDHDAEPDDLLADLDMNALAGTETIEEVIETMTADDLADLDESDEPITAPAPAVNASANIQLSPMTVAATATSAATVMVAPIAPADDLDADDLETLADLERKAEPSDPYEDEPGVVSFRGRKFPKGDPAKIGATLKLFENRRAKKAARTREKTRLRVKKLRANEAAALAAEKAKKAASPLPSKQAIKAMLKALEKAVAKRASTDRFLEKLVGRERAYVRFRLILELDRKASNADVAALYSQRTGTAMNRNQAKRRRYVVDKLLAPGGCWHR
jgi:hypothetical protein